MFLFLFFFFLIHASLIFSYRSLIIMLLNPVAYFFLPYINVKRLCNFWGNKVKESILNMEIYQLKSNIVSSCVHECMWVCEHAQVLWEWEHMLDESARSPEVSSGSKGDNGPTFPAFSWPPTQRNLNRALGLHSESKWTPEASSATQGAGLSVCVSVCDALDCQWTVVSWHYRLHFMLQDLNGSPCCDALCVMWRWVVVIWCKPE